MRSFLSIVAAPALCLGLLGGIVWENQRHARRTDAIPFHKSAQAAVENWPRQIGEWRTVALDKSEQNFRGFALRSEDDPVLPTAATQLLKPNAYFYRIYAKQRAPGARILVESDWHVVSLLVVQCRDPVDMSGHYPPNCYPRNGQRMADEIDRKWDVPGLPKPIVGKEYHFRGGTFIRPDSIVIYNFFVLPGRGIVPDMDQVREASGDYQRKHFGATQVQVLFNDPSMNSKSRDEAFIALMEAGVPTLKALDPPGL